MREVHREGGLKRKYDTMTTGEGPKHEDFCSTHQVAPWLLSTSGTQ